MSLAVASGIVDNEMASIFIAGGALTVAIFPFIASLLREEEPAKSEK